MSELQFEGGMSDEAFNDALRAEVEKNQSEREGRPATGSAQGIASGEAPRQAAFAEAPPPPGPVVLDSQMSELDRQPQEEGVPPTETPVTPPGDGEESPVAAETPAESPYPEEVQQYLDKYGGDLGQALRAATEAQSLLGRQGTELGLERENRARLEARLDAIERQQSVASVGQPLDNLQERISEMVEDNPVAAANWALQTNRRDIYEAVMREWGESEPWDANNFHTSLLLQQRDQAWAQYVSGLAGPVQKQERNEAFQNVLLDASRTVPGFAEVSETELGNIARSMPDYVEVMMSRGPEAQKTMIETLTRLARHEKAGQTPQVAQAAAVLQAEAEEAQRREAFVATPSHTTQAHGVPEKSNQDIFKGRLMAAPDTSIEAALAASRDELRKQNS